MSEVCELEGSPRGTIVTARHRPPKLTFRPQQQKGAVMGKIGKSDSGNAPKGESDGGIPQNGDEELSFLFKFGDQSRLSASAPQDARDREAESIRNREKQGESLSLKLLALAENSRDVPPFTTEEIEWLFFVAMDFQFAAYGGNSPMLEEIEPDDDPARYDLYAWMGEEAPDPEQRQRFVEMLRRNARGPRPLWRSDFLGDDGAEISYLAISPQLSLEALRNQVFVPKLLEHLNVTKDESVSWIIEQTRRMLSEPFYFGSVAKFTMSGFSQFIPPQRPLSPEPHATVEPEGQLDHLVGEGLAFLQAGNRAKARECWEQAAAAGNRDAINNLGMLADEEGDVATGSKLWKQAAAEGSPDAMFNLGCSVHEEGDSTTARHLWEQAAAHKHFGAINRLGMLAEENGDAEAARRLYEEAAAGDYTDAMYNLGCMAYEEGDFRVARKWWEQAAAQGHQQAHQNLSMIADR